jgi:hypothetical protein
MIVDETTDNRARSVVNILFSYCGRLVAVDYINSVNNVIYYGNCIIYTYLYI